MARAARAARRAAARGRDGEGPMPLCASRHRACRVAGSPRHRGNVAPRSARSSHVLAQRPPPSPSHLSHPPGGAVAVQRRGAVLECILQGRVCDLGLSSTWRVDATVTSCQHAHRQTLTTGWRGNAARRARGACTTRTLHAVCAFLSG